MTTRSAAVPALAVALFLPAAAPAAKPHAAVDSGGEERTFFYHVPKGLPDGQPAPLVVVLHGSGHDGWSLVDPWKKLADKEGFLVVGPDAKDPEVWAVPTDGPRFLYDVVEWMKQRYPVDPRRVYLFGHSAGACFALQAALLESRYFAAAAVHAGALSPRDGWLIEGAERKIPIHLTVGTRDQLFPLSVVRATRDALEGGGIPVELVEVPYHDHWYYSTAAKTNRRAWEFLSRYRLEDEPRYEEHLFRAAASE